MDDKEGKENREDDLPSQKTDVAVNADIFYVKNLDDCKPETEEKKSLEN